MKKRLTTAILGAFIGAVALFSHVSTWNTAFAEDVSYLPIGPFGTLNNTDDSLIIPPNKAQALLNVEIAPGGSSAKKRKGYSIAQTLSITTSPVHGVHYFYDSNGNDVALYFNDTRLASSIGGSVKQDIFTTGPPGATWQCVDSQGFAYCANTSRTAIIKTNGQTSSNLTGFSSTGTLVAVTPERLVQSGFSNAPNDIYFSKSNDFSTWTLGAAATDPISFTVTSPGPKITHITYAFDRIVWFKSSSFGYILIGNQPAFADWQIVTVDPNLGTFDNTSVYREGILYFRGQDGHIYSFDGASIKKLTRDIQGNISQSQSRIGNSWTQTTEADFANGYTDNSVYLDTQTVSGNIQLTFPDNFNTFRSTTTGGKGVWTPGFYTVAAGSGTVSSNGSELVFTHDGVASGARTYVYTPRKFNSFTSGTTYHFTISSITTRSITAPLFRFALSNTAPPSGDPNSAGSQFNMDFRSTNTGSGFIFAGTDGTNSFTSNPFPFPLTIDLFLSSSREQIKINGSSVIYSSVGNYSISGNAPFVYFILTNASGSPATAKLDDFGISPETATYHSEVHNAPNLSAWDSFNATKQDNGGTITFAIRAATNTFSLNSSTPSWTILSPGDTPSISTGTFFQIRSTFSVTLATQTPLINDFVQNWFEGGASDKTYAIYHRDAIWWSVTSGAGATRNNMILYYDMLNDGMTIYDIPSNGFYVRSESLYFGSSSSGYVFKYGETDDDNGATINSYWKSKDFVLGSPFQDKEFVNISLAAQSVASSSMTITYTIDGSTSTSYIIPLQSSKAFVKKNRNLPLGKIGQTFNLQFGNDAANQFYEVYGVQAAYRLKSWKPE